MTDQLREKRIGIVGVVIIALFLTLGSRLWYLQVATGDQLAAAATQNRIRVIQEEAPRGRILDVNGNVLVDNRIARSIVVDRQELKEEKKKKEVIDRLSKVLDIDKSDIEARIKDERISPYKPVPIAIDIPLDRIQYIKERQDEFAGVDAVPLAVRRYPNGTLAAHVVGYVGEINDEELKERKENYQLGESIGKSGIEYAYEDALRGTPSTRRVEIDVKGRVLRQVSYTPPVPGHDVVLSIDINLQRVAETSLAEQIEVTRSQQDTNDKTKFTKFKAAGGSVTIVDPQNGFVLALASFPTFDPAAFVEGITTPVWKQLNDPANAYPLNNRAVQGLYAPASTFKMVTAIAGVKSKIVTPNSTFNDTGSLKVSDVVFANAGNKVNGSISLSRALAVSSDTYFYNIGSKLWSLQYKNNPDGDAIQTTAREFGFGSVTGIPIGNESKGRIPDEKWKQAVHKEDPKAFPYAEWLPGDNVNSSVGQGDTLVTPIQIAMAYGAFANGGKLYQPQLVAEILPAGSKKPSSVTKPKLKKTITLDANMVSVMKRGFTSVITSEEGTARAAFDSFPSSISVAGKTGTAEIDGKQDTSLFVGFSPSVNPKYVAVSVIEEAGWGAGTAAPIVRRVFEGAYGLGITSVKFAPPPGGAD
ncbi:MAG TPA: penicillin-binding protein 2 [Acidimicrobiia bacterium]|nr:penicillin-binding protein 2 [Acidimicrobiia bacterium]